MIDTDYVNRLLRLRESLVHLDNAIRSLDKAWPEICSNTSPAPNELVTAYAGLRALVRDAENLQREAWQKLTGGNG